MKITFNKKVRNFEAGKTFDLSALKIGSLVLVGDNGCGKSTILQAIRGSFPSTTKSLHEETYKDLVKEGEVVIEHDYEKTFFLDAVLDNGTHFMNAYDASALIKMGGYTKNKKSHGEGSLIDIHRFMENNKDKFVKGKTLVVLDEVDNGFSLKNMTLFKNLIDKLIYDFGCHVLVSSHNPFYIIQSGLCFDVEKNEIVLSQKYIQEKTGYSMKKGE